MVEDWVSSYGYLAVFLGTLLEGEVMLIAAGFAAHQGLLDWPLVMIVAFFGGTLGDQLAFLLGRWKGAAVIERMPTLAQHAPRVHALLERNDAFFIISMRFMYGLRIAGPIVIGSSGVSLLRFSVFNMIGAVIWAALVTGAGYYFGVALEALFTNIRHAEQVVLVGIIVTGTLLWLWKHLRAAHLRRGK